MRRPVWLAAGMALGVGGTLWAEQRVRRGIRRAADRLAPEQVTEAARAQVRQLGGRMRAALEAGREAHDAREAELWEELGGGPGAGPALPARPHKVPAARRHNGAPVQGAGRRGR